MEPSIEALWPLRNQPAERAALVAHYTPLVRQLVRRVYARRGQHALVWDDLFQEGLTGLLEAIDRFVPSVGVPFPAYAHSRIEGAVLNAMARDTELMRQLDARRTLERERIQAVMAELGTDGEGLPSNLLALQQLSEMAVQIAIGVALEETAMYQADEQGSSPDNAYVRAEARLLKKLLAELVSQLPESEQTVIHRHYVQQQPFESIARTLGLTKGRISQIHHRALRRLREHAKSHRLTVSG